MAGHSKWANIQHRKNRQDAKRGSLWTKIIREVTVAARDGADPGMNSRLRLALEKASGANVPKDTITKAIGYDKGAMVFHMLRRTLGEKAFWGALRDLFREKLFLPASWDDLRQVFERRSGQPLNVFFDQWVQRRGAPRVRLEAVAEEHGQDSGVVAGRLVQEKPAFTAEWYRTAAKNELDLGGYTQAGPTNTTESPVAFYWNAAATWVNATYDNGPSFQKRQLVALRSAAR